MTRGRLLTLRLLLRCLPVFLFSASNATSRSYPCFSFGDLNDPFRLCVSNYIDESPRTCVNTLVGLRVVVDGTICWKKFILSIRSSRNCLVITSLLTTNFTILSLKTLPSNFQFQANLTRNSTSSSSQTNFKVIVF